MRFLVITLALVVALLAVLLQTSCSIGLKSIAFVVVAITYYIVREVLAKRTIEVSGKAVFITGCDSGFGHHLAQRLDSAGVIVFAGCLFEDGEGAATLKSTCSKTLNVVPLDVTSDESVTKARHFVEDNLPNHCEGLWSVVNNAGIWKWGEIEWIKVDILKQLMDVNVFGMMRVTKEFQPLVRKAKGRIVNVGSMSGMWTCPAGAMYCMSKHAVESFTDALRYEMFQWGVKVSLIQPGWFARATRIWLDPEVGIHNLSEELWDGMSQVARSHYGRNYFDAHIKMFLESRDMTSADDTVVIDAMVHAISSKLPKHRYLVGEFLNTKVLVFLMRFLPTWITDIGMTYVITTVFPKPAKLSGTMIKNQATNDK